MVLVLTPSLDFEKKLASSARKFERASAKRKSSKTQTPKRAPLQHQNTTTQLALHHSINLKASTPKSLETLIEDFHRNNDIGIALLIARRYYAKGDFANAAKWSLIANNLDKNNEESWLLYAKSSYKLGKKERALTALKIYYNRSRSKRAYILLKQMLQGTFR